MNTTRTIALVAGLPMTLLTLAGQSAEATASPTGSPTSANAPALPADWVMLTDDTDTISVGVPNAWTDIDTAPGTLDGAQVPFIEASTNIEVYKDSFDAPGVTYVALPFDTDTETLVSESGLTSGCRNETTEPYDDGAFAGHHLIYTGCGSGPPEFHVIAANPANQAFTALLQIQITGPGEQNVLDTILDTFNMTPTAAGATTVPGAPSTTAPGAASVPVPPTTTVDGGPTTSAGGLAPTTTTTETTATTTVPGGTGTSGTYPPPTGEVPADWAPLVDDSETIAMSVPSDWTDINTSADASGDPWISATTDSTLFFPEGEDTFSVPGVIYNALVFDADTEAVLLRTSVYADVCTDNGVQQYDDGVFAGHIQTFTNCGGTSTRILQVAANPADGAFTAFLLIQLTGEPDDDATLNGLLSSFNQVSGGTAGTATSTTLA